MVTVIKRYRTGKLYFVRESRYVSQTEVQSLVSAGHDVLIIDNKTKRDVTAEIINRAPSGPDFKE